MDSILFVAPVFGEYHRIITNTLKRKGAYSHVYFLPECPIYNLGLYATITNLFPFLESALVKFHNKRIATIVKKNKISKIFIIRGEYIDSQQLIKLKDEINNLTIVVYQWDSIKNNPNAGCLLRVADSFYTFDPIDARDKDVSYLPLFYCWDEAGFKPIVKKVKYDIFSVGGYRPHRMSYIYPMKDYCEKNNMTYYIRSFERFGAYIKNKKRLNTKFKDVSFWKLPYFTYYKLLTASRCVLDIHSPCQNGLTMRTIETLSAGKKLITTNGNIKNEPFFDGNNVFILESPNAINSPEFKRFLSSPFVTKQGLLSLTKWLTNMNVL